MTISAPLPSRLRTFTLTFDGASRKFDSCASAPYSLRIASSTRWRFSLRSSDSFASPSTIRSWAGTSEVDLTSSMSGATSLTIW